MKYMVEILDAFIHTFIDLEADPNNVVDFSRLKAAFGTIPAHNLWLTPLALQIR